MYSLSLCIYESQNRNRGERTARQICRAELELWRCGHRTTYKIEEKARKRHITNGKNISLAMQLYCVRCVFYCATVDNTYHTHHSDMLYLCCCLFRFFFSQLYASLLLLFFYLFLVFSLSLSLYLFLSLAIVLACDTHLL